MGVLGGWFNGGGDGDDDAVAPAGRWTGTEGANIMQKPPPLVNNWLHIREEDDREAFQRHKEMEDVRAPVLIVTLSAVARIVTVFLREYADMGTKEGVFPMGKVALIVCGLLPLWYRGVARTFRNPAPHVFWSSLFTDVILLLAAFWGVTWPENSDPTILLCIFLSISWQVSQISFRRVYPRLLAGMPFLRMGVYGVLAVWNIILESQRGALRHAVFLGPAILMYQMYWAEQQSRLSFVLQRHLWRSMSDRTLNKALTAEGPRLASV